MPETMKEFNFGRLTRSPKYSQYLDGEIWKFSAEELEEYPAGATTVRSGINSAANRQDLSLRSQITEDGDLIVQVYEKEDE